MVMVKAMEAPTHMANMAMNMGIHTHTVMATQAPIAARLI